MKKEQTRLTDVKCKLKREVMATPGFLAWVTDNMKLLFIKIQQAVWQGWGAVQKRKKSWVSHMLGLRCQLDIQAEMLKR